MKTYIPTEKDLDRKVYLVNASGKNLGRLASRVATLLIGKGKPFFAMDQLCGDQVIVINAKEIEVTGPSKKSKKLYTHYTGYSGGLKTITYEKLLDKKPETIITRAVNRMLPKNKLGQEMRRRLRVYAGAEHQQQAQKPIPIEV